MVCKTDEYRDKAALGHDWGEASYTWSNDNATCTAKRTRQRDSSHVETKTVDAVEGENTATCEAGGKITYTATFVEPFETQTKTVDTPAQGHDLGEWGNSTATCTSAGKETRTCSRCGATETRDVEPLGHTGVTATCTESA